MRIRLTGLIILSILVVWFLYVERAILTPFVLAGIFAYVFNPLIDFLTKKARLPRTVSIIIIYFFIIFIFIASGSLLTKRVLSESSELKNTINTVMDVAQEQAKTLPEWVLPAAEEGLASFEKTKLLEPASLFSLFPAAISRLVSFIIFLFAAFYFLREGRNMIDTLLHVIPKQYRIDGEILLRKINSVLGGYLRGQILMICLVSLTLFIALSILGVRYALFLALFSGLVEILPFIGPITAGASAVLTVFLANTSFNFGLTQLQAAVIVVLIYFIVRQVQDYFVAPHIMGKITNLHPLLILFSVLAGGHLFGILGFILGIPIAACLRIIFAYLLEKLASN